MAPSFISRKAFLVSIFTISSATVLSWLYLRRRKSSATSRDGDAAVISAKPNNLPSIGSSADTLPSQRRGMMVLLDKVKNNDVVSVADLRNILETFLKATAYSQEQIDFINCGGISVVGDKLGEIQDDRIRGQILQILNNVCLNQHGRLITKNYMPVIWDILKNAPTADLVIKCLQVFTNLTVFDDVHDSILDLIGHGQWARLLQFDNSEVRLQTLKFLVNLSTNKNNIDFLGKRELLQHVTVFVSPNVDEELSLRSVTFLANLLEAEETSDRQSNVKDFVISIPGLHDNTRRLSRSDTESVQFHANRVLNYIS